ncbi:hypothetical protein E2C01_080414 [Portunus trituberculatus]|uniref:Uncharacterized protein n=1 Tax=Portunus trituberculatus TaxID=210409 RepID=A0A5B7IP84_PORTR|nr:hypothetical protein [Portunus trituberculatus]
MMMTSKIALEILMATRSASYLLSLRAMAPNGFHHLPAFLLLPSLPAPPSLFPSSL